MTNFKIFLESFFIFTCICAKFHDSIPFKLLFQKSKFIPGCNLGPWWTMYGTTLLKLISPPPLPHTLSFEIKLNNELIKLSLDLMLCKTSLNLVRRGKLNLQFIVTDFSILHAGGRSLFRFQRVRTTLGSPRLRPLIGHSSLCTRPYSSDQS